MKWGRILLCTKWHCIAWNKQVYSVAFFSVCFPKNVPEWRECKSQNSLFLWVTLPCVTVCTHRILGFCFVINGSCTLFLKQKSLWICLFVFLPSAMKAHVISCMSVVGHNIYNISTVLQFFFSAVVMQVFFLCTTLSDTVSMMHTLQTYCTWKVLVQSSTYDTVTVRWLAV
jgi:hypothetical protein